MTPRRVGVFVAGALVAFFAAGAVVLAAKQLPDAGPALLVAVVLAPLLVFVAGLMAA